VLFDAIGHVRHPKHEPRPGLQATARSADHLLPAHRGEPAHTPGPVQSPALIN